jgi:hypothetical protein
MNEIKVTVAYEKPNTSKFDALMAEYEAAKKYADETVAYYKPLADIAERHVAQDGLVAVVTSEVSESEAERLKAELGEALVSAYRTL